jgi:hypothetical protein
MLGHCLLSMVRLHKLVLCPNSDFSTGFHDHVAPQVEREAETVAGSPSGASPPESVLRLL